MPFAQSLYSLYYTLPSCVMDPTILFQVEISKHAITPSNNGFVGFLKHVCFLIPHSATTSNLLARKEPKSQLINVFSKIEAAFYDVL